MRDRQEAMPLWYSNTKAPHTSHLPAGSLQHKRLDVWLVKMISGLKFSNISFYAILSLLTIHRLFLTALGVEFTKFMKTPNVKNSEFFSSQGGLSLLQCLGNCKKDGTCESMSYSDDDMKCYHSVGRQCGSGEQSLEAIDGWNVYGKHIHPFAANRILFRFTIK